MFVGICESVRAASSGRLGRPLALKHIRMLSLSLSLSPSRTAHLIYLILHSTYIDPLATYSESIVAIFSRHACRMNAERELYRLLFLSIFVINPELIVMLVLMFSSSQSSFFSVIRTLEYVCIRNNKCVAYILNQQLTDLIIKHYIDLSAYQLMLYAHNLYT